MVDLFSGVGGMACGFVARGFEVLEAYDDEEGDEESACNASYMRNIGTVPIRADLRTVDPTEARVGLGLRPNQLRVLLACPPCRGFRSAEGNPRDDLVESVVLPWIRAFRPAWYVGENAGDALAGRRYEHWERFRHALSDLGYAIDAAACDLADWGLPQKRKRALVVARRTDHGKLGEIGAMRSAELVRDHGNRTVRDAIGWLPPIEAGCATHLQHPMHVCPPLGRTARERIRKAAGADRKEPSRCDGRQPGGGGGGSGGGGGGIDGGQRRRRTDAYGRMEWDAPASTIVRGCDQPSSGRYVHPDQDRLFSVLEAALIQGFPVDYRFEGAIGTRYRTIGDAVPPVVSLQLAEAIANAPEFLA